MAYNSQWEESAVILKDLLEQYQYDSDLYYLMGICSYEIGKFQEEYRARCISIGEKTGLYKEEKEVKGCTPNYLPRFIEIEVAKLLKK